MKMKKIIEALPLLGSLSLLIIVAAVFLHFAKAEAALEIDPADATPPAGNINTDATTNQPSTDTTTNTNLTNTTIKTTAPAATVQTTPAPQTNWSMIVFGILSLTLICILVIIIAKRFYGSR